MRYANSITSLLSLSIALINYEYARAEDKQEPPNDIIVITATRRPAPISLSPLSVNAYTRDDIARSNITNIASLINDTPGVSLLSAEPGTPELSIRGVASASSSQTSAGFIANATTTTYLDQVPITTTVNKTPDISLVDIERIEIIKGPQGTLYGQSALGGVIRYIAAQPDLDLHSAELNLETSVTSGGRGNTAADGYINLPIVSGRLGLRAAYVYKFNDGFIKGTPGSNLKHTNSDNTSGRRLLLRFDPNRTFSLVFGYLEQSTDLASLQQTSSTYTTTKFAYSDSNSQAFPYSFGTPYAETLAITPVSLSDLRQQHIQPAETSFNMRWADATWKGDIGQVELIIARKTIGSLRSLITGDAVGGTSGAYQRLKRRSSIRSDTQEIRFTSATSDKAVDWIVGAYHESDNGSIEESAQQINSDYYSYIVVPGYGLYPYTYARVGDRVFDDSRGLEYNEKAVFADVGVNLNDTFRVSGGFRRAWVSNNYKWLYAIGTLDALLSRSAGADQVNHESVDLYRFDFSYKVSSTALLYANAASGYRPGGFNPGNAFAGIGDNIYRSDQTQNYEVGLRKSLWANALQIRVGLFNIDWKHVQLGTIGPAPFYYISVQNAGLGRIRGSEFEAQLKISPSLHVSGSYALTDAILVKATDSAYGSPGGIAGSRLPGTAKHKAYASVDWQGQSHQSRTLTIGTTFRYSSGQPSDFGSANKETGAFTQVDTRIGVRFQSGLRLGLFANNLFDTIPVYRRYAGQLPGYDTLDIGRPRTIGLRLGFSH